MTALSSDCQTEHWDSSWLEPCCTEHVTYPFLLEIAGVAMQFGCRTRAGQHRGSWLSLFSHLHPLKHQEIFGTRKDALEMREITPKRRILQAWDAYLHMFKMSFNVSWKPTGLDSPVVGKVKHRSQCFIYRHCCQSFSESEAAMFMKVSCGACEQFTVPLEAQGCNSHFTLVAFKYVIYCPKLSFCSVRV